MTTVVAKTAERLVPGFEMAPKIQQFSIKSSLTKTVIPLLQALPEGATPGSLPEQIHVLRAVAIDILAKELRGTPQFRDASDYDLLENIPAPVIDASVNSLFQVALVALDVLPPAEDAADLQRLADNFDQVDLDEELEKLLGD